MLSAKMARKITDKNKIIYNITEVLDKIENYAEVGVNSANFPLSDNTVEELIKLGYTIAHLGHNYYNVQW